MKKPQILLLCLLSFLPLLPLSAKKGGEARAILDAMAQRIEKAGGISAQFSVVSFTGTERQGSASGTFLTDGHRFQMKSAQMTTWFDGHTQWSYQKATDEVNIATPTAGELQVMNPYAFVGIYKSGYSLSLSSARYAGKSVHEIRLKAQKRTQDIQRVILTVDPTTLLPLCARVLQGKNQWVRITVSGFKGGQKFPADTFRFDRKKYPKAEVIDLR